MNKVITTKQDYGYHISFTGNIPSKKNSKQIVTKPFPRLVSSKAHQTWHKECTRSYLNGSPLNENKKDDSILILENIRAIEGIFYDKLNKDGSRPKRTFDLSNSFETIADWLVDMKIIEDDNYKIIPQVILSFGGYRDEQGAEVFIYLDNN